jgi:hypothetical protein
LERIVVTMSKYSFLTKNWNVVVQGISLWGAAMSSASNIWITALRDVGRPFSRPLPDAGLMLVARGADKEDKAAA